MSLFAEPYFDIYAQIQWTVTICRHGIVIAFLYLFCRFLSVSDAVKDKFRFFQEGKISFQIVLCIDQFILFPQFSQIQCLFPVAPCFEFQSRFRTHPPFHAKHPVIVRSASVALQQENPELIRGIIKPFQICGNGLRAELFLSQYIIKDYNSICKRGKFTYCISIFPGKIPKPVCRHFLQPFQSQTAFAHAAFSQDYPPGKFLILFQKLRKGLLFLLSSGEFQESIGEVHSSESRGGSSALLIRIHRDQCRQSHSSLQPKQGEFIQKLRNIPIVFSVIDHHSISRQLWCSIPLFHQVKVGNVRSSQFFHCK